VKRYMFLHHTADAKFQAFGATLEEAFANAVLATAFLMWDWKNVEKKIEYPVEIEARDLKQLCFFWVLLKRFGSKRKKADFF